MNAGKLWLGVVLAAGCRPLADAEEGLADALVSAFRGVGADEAQLASTLRNLEAEVYASLAVGGEDLAARSARARRLTRDDVQHLSPRPEAPDPADAMTVTVTRVSTFDVDDHARIALVRDLAAANLDPTARNQYLRAFQEGEACWLARGCDWLRSTATLTKEVPLSPKLTYTLHKDWRWVDLAEEGAPRWAFIAVNWNPETFRSETGDGVVHQSYGVELWLPRDGRGWVADTARPDGFVDSTGGGTLRLFTLWAESALGPALDPTTEEGTIRWGTDRNLLAQEAWLKENP